MYLHVDFGLPKPNLSKLEKGYLCVFFNRPFYFNILGLGGALRWLYDYIEVERSISYLYKCIQNYCVCIYGKVKTQN